LSEPARRLSVRMSGTLVTLELGDIEEKTRKGQTVRLAGIGKTLGESGSNPRWGAEPPSRRGREIRKSSLGSSR
jgi:hypothetical protein